MQTAKVILGGGAAYGLAHIGALKVIAAKYRITGIAGTSMGAIIGALYAIGKTPEEILQIALQSKASRIFSPLHLDRTLSGVFDGKKILCLFSEWTDNMTFSDAKIPLLVIAYDLINNNTVVIDKGSLAKAMRASSSIPYLFAPYKWNRYQFVDGGVEHPLPLAFAENLEGEMTITVNVLPSKTLDPQWIEPDCYESKASRMRLHEVFLRSVMQNQAYLAMHSVLEHKPDIVIDAHLPEYGVFDFDKAQAFYKHGLNRAVDALTSKHQPHNLEKIRYDYRHILSSLAGGFRKVINDWEEKKNALRQDD